MNRYLSKLSRVICVLGVIFLVLAAFASLPQPVQATSPVVATIPVGHVPYAIAFTPDGAYAYVPNNFDDNVSVINTATNMVIATIPVGDEPVGVAVAPNGTYAYVTNTQDNTVSVISTATNTVTDTIIIPGTWPRGIGITPNGAYAYVANKGSDNVSVISLANNSVTDTIPCGASPYAVAISPNGTYAYVTNVGSHSVSVINTTSNTVTATVLVGIFPFHIAISPNGAFVYVTSSNDNTVSVICTANNTLTATLTGYSGAKDVAVTPDGKYVYVTDDGLKLIDTATNNEAVRLAVACDLVAFMPNGSYAYLTYDDNVLVLDTSFLFVMVQPSSRTMNVGQTYTFTAVPDGGSGSYTSYQWYVDGATQIGQTASTFSYTPTAWGTDMITVTVTDSLGETSSQSLNCRISVHYALVAPTVSASYSTIDQGTNSNLTSSAVSTGTSPYTYQWFQKAPGAGSFSTISGATSSYYLFVTSTSTATGTWSFKLQVTDSASDPASVNSSAFNITVSTPPTVSITPVGPLNLDVGQVQTFNASGSGGTGTLSYQWWRDGQPLSSYGVSYSYTATLGSHNVTCKVTDSASHSITVASNTVLINVGQLSITVVQGAHGVIAPGTTNVNYGANQTFTITPNTGYYISSLTVDGNTIAASSSYTFTNVTASHTITATFAINTYTLTVIQSANGAISPPTTTVNYGDSQTFTITPNTGYSIASLKVDGASVTVASSYTFNNVVAPHNITATFTINTYTLTVTQGANGVIAPGTTTVNYGSSQTFTITPNTGYSIASLTVDGGSVTTASSYTFTNVNASHTITAAFSLSPTPTPSGGGGGSSGGGSSSSTTSTPTPSPTETPSPTPLPTPQPTTVPATTATGVTVQLTISGTITSSQMSSITISTDQSAASTTVTFNVTGESGTTGFGNITIPKSAVAYGTTPIINIDGHPAPDQAYTQDANNYYVWYTTHFSTHQISIVFTSSSSPSLPLAAIIGGIAAAAIALAAVALVLTKKKKIKG